MTYLLLTGYPRPLHSCYCNTYQCSAINMDLGDQQNDWYCLKLLFVYKNSVIGFNTSLSTIAATCYENW